MAFGFRKIHDFSALSLKTLNDQLESMWLKVMGGISQKDLSAEFSNIIDGKVGEDNLTSVLMQNKESIAMAVGKIGGDNLIKNGNAYFGLDSWTGNNISVNGGLFTIDSGYIMQTGIRVNASTYTFGMTASTNASYTVNIYGMVNNEYTDIIYSSDSDTFTFDIPSTYSYVSVEIATKGKMEVKEIYLRSGIGILGYSDNPNEMHGNGLNITENGVNITTNSFNLEVKDENGVVQNVLSTSGAKFDNMNCENILIDSHKYVGDTKHIYVNSTLGNDANDGNTTLSPYKTLNKALKDIPYHIKGQYILHLSGGAYYEDMVFNYGGSGLLTIMGERATIYGKVEVHSCNYNMTLDNLNVSSQSLYGVKIDNSKCVRLNKCIINLNGVSGSYGVLVDNFSNCYIRECEIHSSHYAMYVDNGSWLCVDECMGNNNEVAYYVTNLATINTYGVLPSAKVYNYELHGGRQIGMWTNFIEGDNFISPQTPINTLTLTPTFTATYNGNYTFDYMCQGENMGAVYSFDSDLIKNTLTNKTIKDVKLYIKSADTEVVTKTLKMFIHSIVNETNDFILDYEIGEVATISPKEEIYISIPLEFIKRVLQTNATGLCFYGGDTCYLDGSAVLEVCYV